MTVAVITLSAEGMAVARHIARHLPDYSCYCHSDVVESDASQPAVPFERFDRVSALIADRFAKVQGLIFVAPCGVAVRAIAPLLQHKTTDPAVVVVDVGHRHVVSLLSGHEGGANVLAVQVANVLDAEPVITTSSEALRTLIAGIGCRRGVTPERVLGALDSALTAVGRTRLALRLLATIDHKRDEAGLVEAARTLNVPLRLVGADTIRSAELRCAESTFVRDTLDVPAVAEPCALLAGRRPQLLLPKTIHRGVTVAICEERCLWSVSGPEARSIAPAAQSRPSPKPTSLLDTDATSS